MQKICDTAYYEFLFYYTSRQILFENRSVQPSSKTLHRIKRVKLLTESFAMAGLRDL